MMQRTVITQSNRRCPEIRTNQELQVNEKQKIEMENGCPPSASVNTYNIYNLIVYFVAIISSSNSRVRAANI